MGIKNRYFVVNLPNSDSAKIYDVILGYEDQQREVSKNKKQIVKLKEDDTANHPCLNSSVEYDYLGIQQYMKDNYAGTNI